MELSWGFRFTVLGYRVLFREVGFSRVSTRLADWRYALPNSQFLRGLFLLLVEFYGCPDRLKVAQQSLSEHAQRCCFKSDQRFRYIGQVLPGQGATLQPQFTIYGFENLLRNRTTRSSSSGTPHAPKKKILNIASLIRVEAAFTLGVCSAQTLS